MRAYTIQRGWEGGPITVHPREGETYTFRSGQTTIVDADGRTVASMIWADSEGRMSRAETEALARTLAAAPDLLEACKAASRLDYFNEHNALAKQVRAAIAKAEGRSA